MRIAAIDPGLRQLGLSVFEDTRLVRAELVRNPLKKTRGPKAWAAMAEAVELAYWSVYSEPPDVYVTECMQVDGRRGRVDDLFQLYGVGMYAGHSLCPAEIHGYYPRDWKGSVPKDVMVERIRLKLSSVERKAIQSCPDSLRHNVMDSIGVGLFHVGRLGGNR